MMKRVLQLALVCALVVSLVSIATAQAPTPVTRMGDWIEVGNDVYMNFIGNIRVLYQTGHNNEFENDIQDRPGSRASASTTPHTGGGADILYQETRLGFDMKYKKSLRARILLENENTWDGNRIDNGFEIDGDDPADQNFANGDTLGCQDNSAAEGENQDASSSCLQRNTINLERAWIQYDFPGTPIRMRVGAAFWTLDQAGVIADDDPGFQLFFNFGDLELRAWAMLQTESLRIGLSNDNDDVYYAFGGTYNLKPYKFSLDVVYFRFRFRGASDREFAGQQIDTVLVMPAFSGSFGPVTGLLQPMFILGTVDSANDRTPGSRSSYDVKAWSIAGSVSINLGVVRPFFGFLYGSGDDDATDGDLEGFSPLPQGEISNMGGRVFRQLTDSRFVGDRDIATPALAGGLPGSQQFLHTVASPYSDRVGRETHPFTDTTYGNPGIILLPVGVEIFPVKGHTITLFYIYRRVVDSDALERERAAEDDAPAGCCSFDEEIGHELGFRYVWRLNRIFNIKATGNMVIPGDGVKDIAESTFTCGSRGDRQCDGDDLALRADIQFQVQF